METIVQSRYCKNTKWQTTIVIFAISVNDLVMCSQELKLKLDVAKCGYGLSQDHVMESELESTAAKGLEKSETNHYSSRMIRGGY